MMKLYHGSNVSVEVPDLSFSKPDKDFGKGFYLSAECLQDDSTGLYYQSPGYVYSFLKNELTTAKVF